MPSTWLWPMMPQCWGKRSTLAHLTFQHSDGSQPGSDHTRAATMSIPSICLPLPGMTYVSVWQPQGLCGGQKVAFGSQVPSRLLKGGHRWQSRGRGKGRATAGAVQPLSQFPSSTLFLLPGPLCRSNQGLSTAGPMGVSLGCVAKT